MPPPEVLEYWRDLAERTQHEFWRVRVGRLIVCDWSLEEALGSAARVKAFGRGDLSSLLEKPGN
jgi:hypothetical protein